MADTASIRPEFSKWRQFLWPVHGYELKKLLPMFFMFFFISFNYTILRDTKDVLVVTAPGSGAEAIPFIKFWCVLPMAILFMLGYAKLSNMVSKQTLFYVSLVPFIIFFGLFALVIYPNIDKLHPTTSADWLATVLPQGLLGLVALYRNWTYALFYVLSELWGSVGISLLFWGFANDVTRIHEAKRFYSVFGLGANLALLFTGPIIYRISDMRETLAPGIDPWAVSLNYLMSLVVLAGCAVVGLYYYLHNHVLTDPRFMIVENEKKKKKVKAKLTMGESFKFLANSRYLACLAMIVIAYGVAINIYEVTWKSQIKLQYPNPNDYSKFMGIYSFSLGLVSTFMMIFVGGNVMRAFGWATAAALTPIVLLITGTMFFGFVIFRESLAPIFAAFNTTPLMLAVVIGAIQNIMSKAAKYSLFDPTKEMAYIPLDDDSKTKGKAAIDVVGARLGKSGGSLIQQGLLFAFGTLSAITPILAGGVWLWAVGMLSQDFRDLTNKRQRELEEEGIQGKL
jgi:AAA family ATP:ADP antiporter